MNKKVILAIAVIILLITGGALYFAAVLGDMKKNIELTRTLPGQMHEIVRGNDVNHENYDTALEDWNPEDFRRVVFIENFPYYEENLTFRYNVKINELLGTDAYREDPGLTGFISGRSVPFTLGKYDDGSYATRMDYELYFVKLPEKTIVRHVIIEGSNPPKKKKAGESGVGKLLTKKRIAAEIQKVRGF